MKKAVGTALFLVLFVPDGHAVRGQSPDSVARAVGRVMVEQLQSVDLEQRERAIRTLMCLGVTAHGAIPALAHMARNDPIAELRFAALRALGRMGPEARAALPDIRAALNDEDHLVRVHAAGALSALEPGASDVAVLTLANALRYSMRDPVEVPSFFVFAALYDLGPRGRGVEPALVEVVRQGHLVNRLDALRLLEQLGCDSETLVPLLVAVLKDRSLPHYLPSFQSGTVFFLSPLVVGQVPDDPSFLRSVYYEVKSIGELGRVGREQCAQTLGRMGPKAARALPALQEALDDTCPQVRKAARQALQQVEARP